MGSNPINLAIRFLLEILGLMAMGFWAWNQTDGWLRFVLAIGVPVAFAIIWATLAVPDDPSRSGKTIIATPGVVRLAIEFAFFAFAAYVFYDLGYSNISLSFGVIVLLSTYLIASLRARSLLFPLTTIQGEF